MSVSYRKWAIFALLLATALLSVVGRPTIKFAEERPRVDLATSIPKAFGDWREQADALHIVNPQAQGMLDELYSQTLSRTYVNSQGYHVMLSIAYGETQRGKLQMHRPDACYSAQGYSLKNQHRTTVTVAGNTIPAMRMATNLRHRNELVTYWMVVGEEVALTRTDQKLAEVRYALRQRIPDGMLVRVSSIDGNTQAAYQVQDQFSDQLISAIASAVRPRFAGCGSALDVVAMMR